MTRVQYTALRFTQRLHDAGIAPSTGSVGDSFDNALAENLWSTIKVELLYWAGTQFASRAEAEAALLRYIDGWYSPRRIQQGLGGLPPDEYEDAWHQNNNPATIHPEPGRPDNQVCGKPGEPLDPRSVGWQGQTRPTVTQ